MSSAANFEHDVFISYAHIDNEPLAEGLKGWVETLHERLRVRLAQLLGEEARIWRDRKLQGNDIFADTLIDRIAKSAILVSVISPRYVRSEWCLKELNEFSRRAEMDAGLRIGDKLRIFKVVKTHISREQHPPLLQRALGYEFYEYDQTRDRAQEFNSEVVPTRDIRYWEKLDDLAYDIKHLIETLRSSSRPAKSPAAPSQTIYLAETTSDLTGQRDTIKRELQQHGYEILPDKGLPLIGQPFKQEVCNYLNRSQLAVHLIGEHYGIIPEGENRSVIELQHQLAVKQGDGLRRIVWMPVGLEAQDEPQRRFVNRLRLGLASQEGTDLIESKLEDLKTVIQEKLPRQNKPEPTTASVSGNGSAASVYLICDKQDMDSVKPIADYLFDNGMDVTLPAIEGDETQIMQDHKDNLLMCDAVMVYYGCANELWLRMKQRELQKIAGYGRSEPLAAKAIYISAPPTDPKERIRDRDALIIKNYDAFSPEHLQPFLERVKRAKGAEK